MKCLWIQAYLNIDEESIFVGETKVSDLENFKTKQDVPLKEFIDNKTFKLVWK